MKVGFTGTRTGMWLGQITTLRVLLGVLSIEEFHHGDCVGADAQAHDLVREQCPGVKIVVHPPVVPKFRARMIGDLEMPEKAYLDRNRDIIKECDLLIGTPNEYEEKARSGTWYTIREGIRRKKRVIVIWPDGQMESLQ